MISAVAGKMPVAIVVSTPVARSTIEAVPSYVFAVTATVPAGEVSGEFEEANVGSFELVDGIAHRSAGGVTGFATSKPIASASLAGEAVLEAWIDFEREVSVVAARGLDGSFAHFGVIENRHRRHVLDVSIAPAAVPAAVDAAPQRAPAIASDRNTAANCFGSWGRRHAAETAAAAVGGPSPGSAAVGRSPAPAGEASSIAPASPPAPSPRAPVPPAGEDE